MKKFLSVMLCAVLFLAVPVLAADMSGKKAGEMTQQKMSKEAPGKQGKMEKCEKCGKMGDECCCKGMHRMGGMMMHKTIIATEDGGVVVMMGDKLVKYDKNLNLVKEVEFNMEEEECDEECPTCKHSDKDEK